MSKKHQVAGVLKSKPRRQVIVQKFGGTSLGDPKNPKSLKRLNRVADFIAREYRDGYVPVAVVSAMGDLTDDLISEAKAVTPEPISRELDQLMHIGEIRSAALLALALNQRGIPAKSLTGYQMKLETWGKFGSAKIRRVAAIERMSGELKKGTVLICAGFQGIDESGNIQTLGRGGSDTSAVVIAASLGAQCQIFTDVDGVYPVDPRIVPGVKPFKTIRHSEMLAMAAAGAGVIMDRAVEVAQKLNTPLRVLLSPSIGKSAGGTLVSSCGDIDKIESDEIGKIGLAIRKNVAVITVTNIANRPGQAAKVFGSLKDIVIGDAIQGNSGKHASISFWVSADDLPKAERLLAGWRIKKNVNCACLMMICSSMKEGTGYLARLTRSLASANINIEMIATSGISILFIIAEQDLARAAKVIAEEFDLL